MDGAGQLDLPLGTGALTADALAARLAGGTRLRLQLTLTRNRSSMVSVRFTRGGAHLRAHEAFLHAPEDVLDALRAFLTRRRRAAWRVVSAFARRIPTAGAPGRTPSARAGGKGRHVDLEAVRDEVNRTFFRGRVKCRVEWSRASRRRRGGSIRFGSWVAATRTVRVHPLLDSPRIAPEFVRYIVFHEMLHAVVPPVRERETTRYHGPTFKTLERRFPDLARMRRLARHLARTL
jgi:hypothetical protein